MRGIGMKIIDVSLHQDAFQRGIGQILPTARRVMYAAQMLSCPRLMEPVYLVDITCCEEAIENVEACLERRRGELFEVIPRDDTVVRYCKAYLPVSESFGFHTELSESTYGMAYANCIFDHWTLVEGDPLGLAPNALLDDIITPLRLSKGHVRQSMCVCARAHALFCMSNIRLNNKRKIGE
jgi:elongation factor 2